MHAANVDVYRCIVSSSIEDRNAMRNEMNGDSASFGANRWRRLSAVLAWFYKSP